MEQNSLNNLVKPSSTPLLKKVSSASMIEVVLLLVVIVLFYWYLVQPKRAELAVQNAELAQIETDQQSAAQDFTKLQVLVGQLKSDPEDTGRLDESLPLDNRPTRLQMLITTLAKFSGLTVEEVNVPNKSEDIAAGNKPLLNKPFSVPRSLQKVVADVSVIGSFDQLKDFLIKLEDNSRIINVVNLQLTSGKDQTLTMRLNVEAYYFGTK